MSERTIGGKYSLERVLAQGGMGTIWDAFDSQLQRRVAVKLMSPEHVASPAARSQFEREAMAIARLQNPHVIQIYDYGLDEGSPYIVMELLEGEDLEARLRRQGRLPIAAVASLLTQAAKALGPAHGAGIVHRDLKPANIFLARIDSEETVKILDFGLAAIVSGLWGQQHPHFNAGTLMGTPRYMSPEQVRGAAQVDYRSDLWSLAVVAYRAVTGQFPFSANVFGELLVKICTDPVPPPSQVAPDLGPQVDAFFERALARDAERRFQSVREMAAAFTALSRTDRTEKGGKILVVDDEPDVVLMMKQRFRHQIRSGTYEFVFASDGAGALEQLRLHPDLDVVLSDINMPGMDGLTLLSKVAEVNPVIKVIMVSAYSDMANIRVAMNRGAFDFVVKPIDFKDLEITVDKTIKQVRFARTGARSSEENTLLRMFVSDDIRDRLVPMGGGTGAPVSESVEATVAFLDVQGFTAVTRAAAPDAALRVLNANFEIIVPELLAQQGVVEKFVGDAVMAVFRGRDHAARAVTACLAARKQLGAMAERAGESSPYAHGISIGLDSGTLVAGSVGSAAFRRLDYTVLGDVVNTAAYLQAAAARDQILITGQLLQAIGDRFECEPVAPDVLPAKARPVALYKVIRPTHEQQAATEATESIHRDSPTARDTVPESSPDAKAAPSPP